MAYQSRYRRRRRRRNSHYGVLAALILLIVLAIPVGIKVVKSVIGGSVGTANQAVFQVYNSKALIGKEIVDLGGAAPFIDQSGSTVIPLRALSQGLGIADDQVGWEQVTKTVQIKQKKNTIRVQVGSKTLRINDESREMSTAPVMVDGTTYVPVRDICEAFSWKVGFVGPEQGHMIVVSKSKKDLAEDAVKAAAAEALTVLGPSRQQLMDGSVLMRVDSDKLYMNDKSESMKDQNKKTNSVIEVENVRYVPLEAAMATLGGKAEYDGKTKWTVQYQDLESTVTEDGKATVSKKHIKGDGISAYRDTDKNRFYVSAQLFGAMIGKTYSDLGEGAFAYTSQLLDGFDSQKAYLISFSSKLSTAVEVNVPEADVYVALTFDDGPTGKTKDFSNGLTVELLDGLKERGVHATFFMCGYRLKDFNSHCARYLAEGHELGNHTMNHPSSTLTGLTADGIREEVDSNSTLIEQYCGQKPTVMRPVGGAVNDDVRAVMKELGLPIINWDVDTLDWKKRDAESVKTNLLNMVHDGSIVLMHDMYPTTVHGVLAAIDELQKREDKTYAFVTVSELAAIKGVTLEPGVVYNKIDTSMASSTDDTTAS